MPFLHERAWNHDFQDSTPTRFARGCWGACATLDLARFETSVVPRLDKRDPAPWRIENEGLHERRVTLWETDLPQNVQILQHHQSESSRKLVSFYWPSYAAQRFETVRYFVSFHPSSVRTLNACGIHGCSCLCAHYEAQRVHNNYWFRI